MVNRGNELYWLLVADLMRREGLIQREAQHQVILRAILTAHSTGMSTHAICRKLQDRWGLYFTTIYKHLAKARRTICIP